jgi:protein SCO1
VTVRQEKTLTAGSRCTTGRRLLRAAATVWASAAIVAALSPVAYGAQHERWGGDYFSNVVLTTQDGVQVRFYDDLIKGKIVGINLIYTTCQYACPLETARLAQVQRLLGDRMGRDVFFYSITIDPEHDTPQVLKKYAENYRAGPGWLFLTGKAADIESISRKLGLYSEPDPADPDGHTPSLVVGNERTGQWMRNSALDNPKFLARTIGEWLNSWQTARKELKSFAEVPTMTFDQGQYTFRNHCAACHTIGRGDAIGPDLKDVTAGRDRRWLARFIVEPEKVFAEGDPIAHALLAKYKFVRMPSLSLTDADAGRVIDYIARQSADVSLPSTPEPANAAEPASAGTPSRAAAADMKPIVEAYLRIQQALSADSLEGVTENARIIATEAVKIGSPAGSIRAAVNPFAQAVELTAAREAFGSLSDAVIRAANGQMATLGDDVKVAYCPMLRKYWLQTGGTIRNPFYGEAMMDCGRLVDDLPALPK